MPVASHYSRFFWIFMQYEYVQKVHHLWMGHFSLFLRVFNARTQPHNLQRDDVIPLFICSQVPQMLILCINVWAGTSLLSVGLPSSAIILIVGLSYFNFHIRICNPKHHIHLVIPVIYGWETKCLIGGISCMPPPWNKSEPMEIIGGYASKKKCGCSIL